MSRFLSSSEGDFLLVRVNHGIRTNQRLWSRRKPCRCIQQVFGFLAGCADRKPRSGHTWETAHECHIPPAGGGRCTPHAGQTHNRDIPDHPGILARSGYSLPEQATRNSCLPIASCHLMIRDTCIPVRCSHIHRPPVSFRIQKRLNPDYPSKRTKKHNVKTRIHTL